MMRLRKGIDLEQVARALGVATVTLAAIERGELKASEQCLDEWENAIVRARAPRPWWRTTV
jgi:transcriptional regulator with XRE-family HTH domain